MSPCSSELPPPACIAFCSNSSALVSAILAVSSSCCMFSLKSRSISVYQVRPGDQAPVGAHLVVLHLDHGRYDRTVAQSATLGFLYSLLGLADQSLGDRVGLLMGLLAELCEDPLYVDGMLAGLLEVLLDGALEALVSGVLDHLLLALRKAVLGVDLAELVDEELLCVGIGIFKPSLRLPAKIPLTRHRGGRIGCGLKNG